MKLSIQINKTYPNKSLAAHLIQWTALYSAHWISSGIGNKAVAGGVRVIHGSEFIPLQCIIIIIIICFCSVTDGNLIKK